jgi:hypothetical protein
MTSKGLEHPIFHPRPAIQPCSEDIDKLARFNDTERTHFGGADAPGHMTKCWARKQLQAPVATVFAERTANNPTPWMTGLPGH